VAQKGAKIWKIDILKNIMNHWPEYADVWQRSPLGQGNSSLFK